MMMLHSEKQIEEDNAMALEPKLNGGAVVTTSEEDNLLSIVAA